jgi:hypothetical protein
MKYRPSLRLDYGTRVAFSRQFLRDTAQYTGRVPFARGTVKACESFGSGFLAYVHWDDGHAGKVLTSNLVRIMTYLTILPNPFLTIEEPRKVRRARKLLRRAKRGLKRTKRK